MSSSVQIRATTFSKSAIDLIIKRFRERGITSEADSLETKAKSHFIASFYGHKIERNGCRDTYVYYLVARGIHQNETGDFEDTWEWTALNSSADGSLEEKLLNDLRLALADYLADRPIKEHNSASAVNRQP